MHHQAFQSFCRVVLEIGFIFIFWPWALDANTNQIFLFSDEVLSKSYVNAGTDLREMLERYYMTKWVGSLKNSMGRGNSVIAVNTNHTNMKFILTVSI